MSCWSAITAGIWAKRNTGAKERSGNRQRHIPFIVRGPGIKAGSKCTQPVSLIDVYPSLVDLAGLEIPNWLDGTSIKPQLANPSSPRGPAISSYGEGNTSIRTEHWRYIRYEDGSE